MIGGKGLHNKLMTLEAENRDDFFLLSFYLEAQDSSEVHSAAADWNTRFWGNLSIS